MIFSILFTIVLFLAVIAVLILIHELGHFLSAKLFHVRVDEFALGFPPRLWSFTKGETTYAVNAIPIGGYVKIFGEDPLLEHIEENNKHRSLFYQSKWVQAFILSAGILMNVLFGWLLISVGYMIGLPAPADQGNPHVSNAQLVITEVAPNSPAAKAGIIPGDVIITAAAGREVIEHPTSDQVSDLVSKAQVPIALTYEQGKTMHSVTMQPVKGIVAGKQAIGVVMDSVGTLRLSFFPALVQGAVTSWNLIESVAIGFFQFIAALIHPQAALSQVSGPVGIARAVSQASSIGFVYLLSLVALISLNLAVINIMPFPALDGGRLLFLLIEALRGKPLNQKATYYANMIGLYILLALILVITLHDLYVIL